MTPSDEASAAALPQIILDQSDEVASQTAPSGNIGHEFWNAMKEWVRRELRLAASGVSEDERRDTHNP